MSTASDTIKKKESGKGGIGKFVRDTRSEWDKTSFQSSEYVINTTVIVVISTIFFTIFLFLVDKGWVFLLEQLSNLVNAIAGI